MADMLPVLAGGLDEAEYGLAPLPVPDSMVGTHANSDAGFGTFAIFARSEHPTETFDFLTWLVKDPDRAVERIVGTSRLPVRTDVETNEKSKLRWQVIGWSSHLRRRFPSAVATYHLVISKLFTWPFPKRFRL